MKSNDCSQDGEVCVEVDGLWKIFGHDAEQLLKSDKRFADRETTQKETGCVIAVRNVSFKVHRGEFFVIMGLSGSGKSTLIRCILRLTEPTAGKTIINGEDISTFDEEQLINLRRHTTSMVFQHFGLFPHRSVIDNVAYGLKVRGVDKEERYARAREVIEKVGLKGWEDYLPNALSGGMQQRVGLARALATDPEILLMDEPFSALDPLIRRQMQDEFIELQAEVRKTVIFVTHDIHEALKLGDRIAIMKDGDIVQIGSPEEVVVTPHDGYVSEFVKDASPAKVLTACNIMGQPSVLFYEWQGPKAALKILEDADLDSAFLVTRAHKLLGLVTLPRLAQLIKKKGASLKEAVETEVATCAPETLVEELFHLAATNDCIAVVDDDGKLIGDVHTSAILLSMTQEMDTEKNDKEEDQDS